MPATQRVKITLPEEIVEKLRRYVPTGSRSRFIAKVIEEKLYKKSR